VTAFRIDRTSPIATITAGLSARRAPSLRDDHALAIHGPYLGRTRAIALADLGHDHLRQDDAEAALATWGDFLDSAEGIRSVKVTEAAASMRARLHRVMHVPAAQKRDQRAAALLA
jgi:hypothetical protein